MLSHSRFAAIVSLFLLFPHETVHAYITWDYDHQDLWSETYPDCSEPDQSPIDIQTVDVIVDPTICNSSFDWSIDLSHETFELRNNGHSLMMSPVQKWDKASDWFDLEDSNGTAYIYLNSNDNTIAKFPNYLKPDGSIDDTFCFHSAHFHWGLTDATGSEHLVDGFQYPLEAHFVHYSCAHNNIGEAFRQFETIQNYSAAVANGSDVRLIAIVSIFYDVVDDTINPAFDTMFANDTLQQIIEPIDYEIYNTPVIVNDLDLSALIPDDIYTAGYYAYEGSLTNPPCYSINRWHVMNARGYIHRSQLEMLRKLKKYSNLNSSETDYLAPNYREVQDNDNNIYACMDVTAAPSSQPTKEPTVDILGRDLDFVSTTYDAYVPPSNIQQKQGQFSWWSAAIIASLGTAAIMGLVFIIVYKNQEKTIRKRLHTKSFNETTQNNDHDVKESIAAPGATYAVDINESQSPSLGGFAPSAPGLEENSLTAREEGVCKVTGSEFN